MIYRMSLAGSGPSQTSWNVSVFLRGVAEDEPTAFGQRFFFKKSPFIFLLLIFLRVFNFSSFVNKTKKKGRKNAEPHPAEELTPPQLSVLARSFPVPRGRTATGGWGFICSSSRVDRIQPTYAEKHSDY